MSNIFNAQLKVAPSFSEPELIITYAQASGAFSVLKGGAPRVKLGPGDLYVYINSLDLRTEAVASQAASNYLPSASLVATYASTQTYLIRTRSTYDHHDMQAAANYSVALPQARELADRQGIFQQMRTGLLYGFSPANGEGLLNTVGAYSVTLPPDSYGNNTLSTYDNGEMSLFILGQIVLTKTRTYQSGRNVKTKVVILSPQRVFLQLSYADIVQLTIYQRPGAGTATTGEVIQNTVEAAGDEIEYQFDDTLIGKGAGGSDAVIITITEVVVPRHEGINTNAFAEVNPSLTDVNLMYADMAAPRKIPTPTPDGGITVVSELRVTSGWGVRPEGLTILSVPYE